MFNIDLFKIPVNKFILIAITLAGLFLPPLCFTFFYARNIFNQYSLFTLSLLSLGMTFPFTLINFTSLNYMRINKDEKSYYYDMAIAACINYIYFYTSPSLFLLIEPESVTAYGQKATFALRNVILRGSALAVGLLFVSIARKANFGKTVS